MQKERDSLQNKEVPLYWEFIEGQQLLIINCNMLI